MVFGCNLLSRKRCSASRSKNGCPLANTYTLIATPLGGDVLLVPELNQPKVLGDKMELVFSEPPSYQSTPLKAPYTVEVLDHAVSPALSIISDQGSSFMEGSPRGDAHSVPRIEDSLEQLDKLEEDLEAFGAVAAGRRAASPEKKLLSTNGPKSKRASVAGRAATVRIKSSEQARPALRRSSSLAFHETHTDQPDSMVEQKAHASLSRSRSTNLRSTAAKNATFKSTKPATVPNFELPGEAVARRLREQREARLAKQADAQKAPRAPAPALAPPKLKPHQPLTRPTFELPGEAISRKKREEREARLRAQEEEERKRREFKARPMRTISNPSTFVRETVTSRARQGKPQPAAVTNKQDEANQAKRMSGSFNRTQAHPVLVNSSPLSRGRNSMTLASNDLSRATSTSTGSASGKRSTLSAEEAAQLKLRGRDVFTRDNSFSRDLEREKREREAVTKSARELAAERSRAASREWAEKRRQRELAMREPAKACGQ